MSETGHARNVQRFQEMVSAVAAGGPNYKPGTANLELANLQTKLTEAEAALDALIAGVASAKTLINDRENAFKGMRKRVTRTVAYYEAVGTDENRIADARTLKRKIDGQRAEALKDDPATPEDETLNAISVSQQSYTQLVEHLEALIALLGSDPAYTPNETELSIAGLTAWAAELKAKNIAVINGLVAEANARASRNTVLYAPATGMVDTALAVKKYVLAAFGNDSPLYQQIKGLEFKRIEP